MTQSDPRPMQALTTAHAELVAATRQLEALLVRTTSPVVPSPAVRAN